MRGRQAPPPAALDLGQPIGIVEYGTAARSPPILLSLMFSSQVAQRRSHQPHVHDGTQIKFSIFRLYCLHSFGLVEYANRIQGLRCIPIFGIEHKRFTQLFCPPVDLAVSAKRQP